MATVARFEDLEVWQKARALANEVYAVSGDGAFGRDFGLRNQVRRAAVSVMANIAEGFERGGDTEFRQFLAVAKGSCGEVRSHLYAALDQGYVASEQHRQVAEQAEEIGRMIAGLMRHLRQSPFRGNKYK
jgi:four helix bundle protein